MEISLFSAAAQGFLNLLHVKIFLAMAIGASVGTFTAVAPLPLLVFLYTWIEGKEKWFTALIATACTYALVWGLFEYMLETRWPRGILFD
ncbi:MAG: hypothetical protein ACREQ2_00485 [Candidatus Binatia bacterium]